MGETAAEIIAGSLAREPTIIEKRQACATGAGPVVPSEVHASSVDGALWRPA